MKQPAILAGAAAAAILIGALGTPWPAAADGAARDHSFSDTHEQGSRIPVPAVQTDEDRIPSAYNPEDLATGLDLSSSQHLGATEEADFWLANNKAGLLCIVGAFDGQNWLLVAACHKPEIVAKHGIGIQMESGKRAAEAYYTAGVNAVHPLLTARSSNLVSLDPHLSAAERSAIAAALGDLIIAPEPSTLEAPR